MFLAVTTTGCGTVALRGTRIYFPEKTPTMVKPVAVIYDSKCCRFVSGMRYDSDLNALHADMYHFNLPCCRSRSRTLTFLVQSQACYQLHQATMKKFKNADLLVFLFLSTVKSLRTQISVTIQCTLQKFSLKYPPHGR